MYTIISHLALGISLIVLLSGCGGGGGSSVQQNTIAVANRQLQVGDRFDYAVTVDVTPPPAVRPIAARTDVVEYGHQPAQYGGRSLTVRKQLRQTMDGETHTYETRTYIEQGADGTIYYAGGQYRQDNGNWNERLIESSDKPAVYMSGSMQVGETYCFTAFWNDGENSSFTKTVEGIETVDNMQSYLMSNCTYSGTSKECFTPAIGWFNKQKTVENRPYGTITTTCVLSSKNF